MSLKDYKGKKDFRFDLKDLTLVKLDELLGQTFMVNDADYVPCDDGEGGKVDRLALVIDDGRFFFAPTVLEDTFKHACIGDDAEQNYLELRSGVKITLKKSKSKNGREYYDFDWA